MGGAVSTMGCQPVLHKRHMCPPSLTWSEHTGERCSLKGGAVWVEDRVPRWW